MSRHVFPWEGAVLVAVLLTGCAAQQRENFLRDRAAEHVYAQPLEEMWPRVKAVLQSQGYSWREMPNRFVLETEWKENGGGTLGHSYSRFLIEGMRVKSGGAILRVMRNDASSQPTAVSYAGTMGSANSTRAANDAMVNASNSNTTGMTPVQKRAYRDLELELELLRVIDLDAATELEAQAQEKYPK